MNLKLAMDAKPEVDDELIDFCDVAGYAIDINYLKGYVSVTVGKTKVTKNSTTEMLAWLKARRSSW